MIGVVPLCGKWDKRTVGDQQAIAQDITLKSNVYKVIRG
jgi:hypothetical protein